jgi:hypothetical protein
MRMDPDSADIAARVRHARRVGVLLQRIGWVVAALGGIGVVCYTVLWATNEIDADQGVSLILGTALAVALSGATSYGAGVNLGLGADRLSLAARDAAGAGSLPPAAERDRG